ncbi:MAG: sensor histidine kinase [Crocinitomicaceae bacterium]|nr:sensor histidine kinase [Crocinitomicaceae bacterium]
MNWINKILNLDRHKFGNREKDHLYYLSGIFFLLAGIIPLIEGLSHLGTRHQFFGLIHILFSLILVLLGLLRRVVNARLIVHFGFLLTAFELYYYNIYFGAESGNYVWYGAFQIAVALFFFPYFKIDFYVQIGISFISLLCSFYGPFIVEKTIMSQAEIDELFIFNTLTGTFVFFGFGIFYIRQMNYTTKEIEQKIKEKEILLAEVNHRVRNNLNVISSLLKLQKESLKTEEARDAISQSALRVHSMAWVHNHLYKDNEDGEIDFKEYIEQLVKEIRYSTGIEKEILLQLEVDSVNLDVSKAIPLGQIINELITNSIKHAFHEVSDPEIGVSIHQLKDEIELIYKDNGKGYDRSKVSLESLGSFLIESLSEQLDGRAALETEGKFEFHLRIKNVLV